MIRDANEARGKSLKAALRLTEVFHNRGNAHVGSGSVEEILNRAISRLTIGDDDKAIKDATEAIRLDPKAAKAYRTRALIYMKRSEYDQAITDLDEAIRLDPEYAEAFGVRASVHTHMRRLASAISDWTSAIGLKPTYGDAYCGRAFAYVKTGDFEETIADATDAIRLDPTDADAHCARGLAFSARNELDKAIRDFGEAIRLNPCYANAYCARAAAFNMKGELNKAVADATEAIRLEPNYADAYRYRGIAYGAKGERRKAFADFTKVEEAFSVPSAAPSSSETTEPAGAFSRGQWRGCFCKSVCEAARRSGSEVIEHYKNKRRFARAYFAIEKDIGQTKSRVRQNIAQGEYTFFTAVGIPRRVMTPEIAEEMLRTWSLAVQSQLHRLALHFQLRWNDEIQKHRPRTGHMGILGGISCFACFPFVRRSSLSGLSKI